MDYKAPVEFCNAYCSISSTEDIKQRKYAFKIKPDGTFRIEDVPAGAYNLQITLHERLLNRDGSYPECIGEIKYEFTIPEMEEGFNTEPLDIGTLELEMK